MIRENKLLAMLGTEAVASLSPYLEEVDLHAGQTLVRQGHHMRYVLFPLSGVISAVAQADDEQIEVTLIGAEGMLGSLALLGVAGSPIEAFVQIPGRGLRLGLTDIEAIPELKPTFVRLAHQYLEILLVQICHTSLANGRGTVKKRLARWLLMAHDRVAGDDIPLTHVLLANSLGVHRPGVTAALHELEGDQAIRACRRSITIRDRDRLKAVASASYGVPEDLYGRLLGSPFNKESEMCNIH